MSISKIEEIKSKDMACPDCKNKLYYWISDDYYNKGHYFYECKVCGWKPSYTNLTLLKIDFEYPVGMAGTSTPVQYAYFLNKETQEVIKKEVKL